MKFASRILFPVLEPTTGLANAYLIADDDQDAVELLQTLFRYEFPLATIDCAVDGQHAVELAELTRPDCVVLDLEMPRLDGEQAALRIAALYPECLPLLIALSGNTVRLSRLQGTGTFANLQAKPCNFEDLLMVLRPAS